MSLRGEFVDLKNFQTTVTEREILGLVQEMAKLREKELTVDLNKVGDHARQIAIQLARARMNQNRDASRSSRAGEHFASSFHVEVQKRKSRGGNSEITLTMWSDHPVANILEHGKSERYVIAPRSGNHLAWPPDNVSALDPKTAIVRKGSVTWDAFGENSNDDGVHGAASGYHVMEEAVEIAAEEQGVLPGRLISRRPSTGKRASGTKRRAPRSR